MMNREYTIQVGVLAIPRRARLRMEKKTELEAQAFCEMGRDGRREHIVVSRLESGSPAKWHFYGGCRRQ